MIKRLRIKFICINMVIVTVMLGVIFGMVLHFTKNSVEMESIRTMRAVAAAPAQAPVPRNPYLIVLVDGFGTLHASNEENYGLSQQELATVTQLALKSETQNGILVDYDLRYCCFHSPEGVKVIFSDTSAEMGMLKNLVKDCLLIGGISLVIFFFISVVLARWAVKPVEHSWTQQRQFVADASHELKTPLTVILTNAELLQSDDYDQTQKSGFVQNILAMSQQMRGLVERLLEMARVDAGQIYTKKQNVDFSRTVANALLSFEVSFFEHGLQLHSHIDERLWVWGSEHHLQQVVGILLDNAMKYSEAGTTVVSLSGQANTAKLTVSNPGAAISREDLKNIFKRFYRVDAARSMKRSYGLGLSIAEGIVKDHGGKIKAESENGMNTFTVSIPLTKTRC